MLLVDYDEAQVFEYDLVLYDGMGADDQVGSSRLYGFIYIFLFIFRSAAGKEDNTEGVSKEFTGIVIVLVGQYFRRGHEGGLAALFQDHGYGGHGNHCFTRSDVSLEQAVHGCGRCDIMAQCFNCGLLIGRKLEGE